MLHDVIHDCEYFFVWECPDIIVSHINFSCQVCQDGEALPSAVVGVSRSSDCSRT